MKNLLLISLALLTISFNVFSAEIGEDQKSPCPYAVQSASREAKPIIPSIIEHNVDAEQAEKEMKTIAK
jgi:hypothetical protein